MQPLPHRYAVTAVVSAADEIELTTEGVGPLQTAAPAAFDGPGNHWSPETLLVGAVADCFAITFRGIARASKLAWSGMTCEVIGTLDRVDGAMRFTHVDLHVSLIVPKDTDQERARGILEKSERTCLITNSLKATVHLHPAIEARASTPSSA